MNPLVPIFVSNAALDVQLLVAARRDPFDSSVAGSNTPSRFAEPQPSWSQAGFSMIEVLVTLLIISLALLGTVGLQAYSMRLNQSGQFRTQAVLLVADLAERIEANKVGAVDGAYVVATSNTPSALSTACNASACRCLPGACTALADYDLSQWQNMVASTLPQSTWEVCIDADLDGTCDPVPVPSNPISYRIRISWGDRGTNTAYAAHDANSQTGINAAASGERFFYTATRTVFQ